MKKSENSTNYSDCYNEDVVAFLTKLFNMYAVKRVNYLPIGVRLAFIDYYNQRKKFPLIIELREDGRICFVKFDNGKEATFLLESYAELLRHFNSDIPVDIDKIVKNTIHRHPAPIITYIGGVDKASIVREAGEPIDVDTTKGSLNGMNKSSKADNPFGYFDKVYSSFDADSNAIWNKNDST